MDGDYNKKNSTLFQVILSFVALYVTIIILIFPAELMQDLFSRWVLVTVLFIIVFFFQFYILNEKVKNERLQNEKLKKVVKEQEESAKLLIRRDAELTKANKKLLELDQAKSEFVSVAAHQLRTPLSGIKWGLDMLLNGGNEDNLTDEQKRILLKSYESNERMINLVNNLLNADRIESGRSSMNFAPVQLKDVIDNVMYYVKPQAEKKNVVLTFSPKGEIPKVLADGQKIREVFQNLLDNAIKYTPEEGSVDIALESKGDTEVLCTVADSGIGIPKDKHNQIFKKFFRSDNAVKVKTEGTGLGLYVAKEIVEKHEGKIWFESDEGKGATFFVLLPVNLKEEGEDD